MKLSKSVLLSIALFGASASIFSYAQIHIVQGSSPTERGEHFKTLLKQANSGDQIVFNDEVQLLNGTGKLDIPNVTIKANSSGSNNRLHIVGYNLNLIGNATFENLNLSLKPTRTLSESFAGLSPLGPGAKPTLILTNGHDLTLDKVTTNVDGDNEKTRPIIILGGGTPSDEEKLIITGSSKESKFAGIVVDNTKSLDVNGGLVDNRNTINTSTSTVVIELGSNTSVLGGLSLNGDNKISILSKSLNVSEINTGTAKNVSLSFSETRQVGISGVLKTNNDAKFENLTLDGTNVTLESNVTITNLELKNGAELKLKESIDGTPHRAKITNLKSEGNNKLILKENDDEWSGANTITVDSVNIENGKLEFDGKKSDLTFPSDVTADSIGNYIPSKKQENAPSETPDASASNPNSSNSEPTEVVTPPENPPKGDQTPDDNPENENHDGESGRTTDGDSASTPSTTLSPAAPSKPPAAQTQDGQGTGTGVGGSAEAGAGEAGANNAGANDTVGSESEGSATDTDSSVGDGKNDASEAGSKDTEEASQPDTSSTVDLNAQAQTGETPSVGGDSTTLNNGQGGESSEPSTSTPTPVQPSTPATTTSSDNGEADTPAVTPVVPPTGEQNTGAGTEVGKDQAGSKEHQEEKPDQAQKEGEQANKTQDGTTTQGENDTKENNGQASGQGTSDVGASEHTGNTNDAGTSVDGSGAAAGGSNVGGTDSGQSNTVTDGQGEQDASNQGGKDGAQEDKTPPITNESAVENQGNSKPDKPVADKPTENPAEQPAEEQPAEDKLVEQPTETPKEKPAEKSVKDGIIDALKGLFIKNKLNDKQQQQVAEKTEESLKDLASAYADYDFIFSLDAARVTENRLNDLSMLNGLESASIDNYAFLAQSARALKARNSVWVSTSIGQQRGDSKRRSHSINLGYDEQFGNLLFGTFVSYLHQKGERGELSSKLHGYAFNIYAKYNQDAHEVIGLLNVGRSKAHLQRNISALGVSNQADAKGKFVGLRVEYGYRMPFEQYGLQIKPLVGLSYNLGRQAAFTEHGTVMPVHVGKIKAQRLSLEAGVELKKYFETAYVYAKPMIQTDLMARSNDVDVRFVDTPNSIPFKSATKKKTYFALSLGTQVQLRKNLLLDLNANSRIGNNERDIQGSVKLGYKF